MVSDQIGDFLTRIRNAIKVGHLHCRAPYSRLKEKIAAILREQGYIVAYRKMSEKGKRMEIAIDLKYKGRLSVIHGIKRISKPGLRIYVKSINLPVVLQGMGIAIVSTSQGVMTSGESKRRNLGGEVLAHVW